jgi:FkbM family methyltransferase
MYEGPITKEYIKPYLPADPVILEAGAHIGRDTMKMATLWPSGTIYAFEPVPELYAQLLERTKERSNVICDSRALSNENGTATFFVSSGATTAASSLLEPHEYRIQRPEVQFHPTTVTTITLDSWAAENGVKNIDFMWLDMQGSELNVLKAASTMLPTVQAILIEVNLTERFKGNPSYEEVKAWLEAHGFTLAAQDAPKHNKINLFFIREAA